MPVQEVLYFEAADKYVRVLTEGHEYLIRTPLKDLLPQLDPDQFWQVHRGTVVRADAIDRVLRDEAGKLSLTLRGRARGFLSCLCGSERVTVARLWIHYFLSCLCGSERWPVPGAGDGDFLSCLCGSELTCARWPVPGAFLSCLCGSERTNGHTHSPYAFLSCLCGSER